MKRLQAIQCVLQSVLQGVSHGISHSDAQWDGFEAQLFSASTFIDENDSICVVFRHKPTARAPGRFLYLQPANQGNVFFVPIQKRLNRRKQHG